MLINTYHFWYINKNILIRKIHLILIISPNELSNFCVANDKKILSPINPLFCIRLSISSYYEKQLTICFQSTIKSESRIILAPSEILRISLLIWFYWVN
jgi:hypothetical protein